jgi:hypothetical protein
MRLTLIVMNDDDSNYDIMGFGNNWEPRFWRQTEHPSCTHATRSIFDSYVLTWDACAEVAA